MTRIRLPLLLLSVTTALLLTSTAADAQLGGLIKRKAKDAVQKPTKEAPKAADAPMKDIYAEPDVVPITTDQLERLEKALKYEVTERNAALNDKPAKTPKEYETCSQNTMMSAEVQKMTLDWGNKLDPNAPADEAAKSMLKLNESIVALVVKRCGENPQGWELRRNVRLQAIPELASDIAMPERWKPKSSGDEASSAHSAPTGPWAGDAPESTELSQMVHLFARAYAILKERVTPACIQIGDGTLVIGSVGAGVKVPFQGGGPTAGVYIYTNAEIKALAPKCPSLMTWLKQLL